MERDRLFQDIGSFAEALDQSGVKLRDLQGTARAMTKGAEGASLEDLRQAKRELTILERTLRRREAKRASQIFDLRERIAMAIFCGVFGGAILDRSYEILNEGQEQPSFTAATDMFLPEADEDIEEFPESAGEKIAPPIPEEPEPLRVAARHHTVRRRFHESSLSEATILETSRYLLGTPRIRIPPIHQEIGMIDRARFPETNEHGYVAVLLAGRRGIGQPGGGPLLDSMKEIIIDPVTGRSIIINLPRDLAVQYRNGRGMTFRNKLNTVRQNAGGEVLNRVVAEITGQPVTHTVVIDLAEMESLSGEFLKILGGRIIVEDPRGKHFWSDSERYYPPRFALTTPEEVHLYVRFRHGYEVKPIYGERNSGPFPRPKPDEVVRRLGSSDSRCERQSVFLRSLFENLRGVNIFNISDLMSFANNHFGISPGQQAEFAFLSRRMQSPQTVPTQYWSYALPDNDGVVRKSTVAIDPNRIRRKIQAHLKPKDVVRIEFPAPAQKFVSAVPVPKIYGSSRIPRHTRHQ